MSEAKPTTETTETKTNGVAAHSVIGMLLEDIKFKNLQLNVLREDEENAVSTSKEKQSEEISHDVDQDGNPIEIWTTRTV